LFIYGGLKMPKDKQTTTALFDCSPRELVEPLGEHRGKAKRDENIKADQTDKKSTKKSLLD
jgi:hypothetical protein